MRVGLAATFATNPNLHERMCSPTQKPLLAHLSAPLQMSPFPHGASSHRASRNCLAVTGCSGNRLAARPQSSKEATLATLNCHALKALKLQAAISIIKPIKVV